MEDLDEQVAADFERACRLLEQHGAKRVVLRFPEVHERIPLFNAIVPAELISNLTAEKFIKIRDQIDTVSAQRAAVGLDTTAHAYLSAQRRRRFLAAKARATFDDVDAWISPTCPHLPVPLADLDNPQGHARALLSSRNTQPGNLLEFCALSIPMQQEGLPTGFQINMPLNTDAKLLSTGLAVESLLNASLA